MTDEDLAVDPEEASEQEEAAEEPELSEEEQAMAKLKEAITVEREEIGSLRVKLTVTVPRETLDERLGEQFAELKRDADVPGFRRGHAPMQLVEKRFGADVGDQLKSQLLSSGYLAAVEKEELKTLGDPLFWMKVKEERTGEDFKTQTVETEKLLPFDKALDTFKMPKEGSLTFACEVELKPDFELPKLEKIPVSRPALTIDDDDVDAELKRLCMTRGTFVPVEEGGVEADDMLYADMKMSVDGETIASEDNFDLAARDVTVQGVQLTGFGDAVVGKEVDQQVTFEAEVQDDHENIDIRGKTAKFEFTLREIKRFEVPSVDAEFLSTVGFDSEDELRKVIRANLEARLDGMLGRAMREQIGEYLVEKTEFEIPEGLSQRQAERAVARRMIEMLQAGLPQAEVEKSLDEMRAKARDQVVRDLKLYFILEKIADEREVDVPEERINAAIAEIARQSNKRFDRVRDELSKGDGLSTLYLQLRDEQVLELLLADAEITETERPKKKSPKKKAAKKKKAKKRTKKE
jgi:trigger factor